MHESTSNMKTVSRGEFELASLKEFKNPERNYQHAFSCPSGQKTFGPYSIDLYSPVTKTVTQYQGCEVHGHLPPDCCKPSRQNLKSETAKSLYGKSAAELDAETIKFQNYLYVSFPDDVKEVEYLYECHWKQFKKSNNWKNFVQASNIDLNRPLNRLIPRTAMRSGLLDVYNLRWQKCESLGETFKVADVNGLYASVCMNKAFPVGKPITLIGSEVSHISIQENQLFYKDQALDSGSIHCTVAAPQSELKPFLQYRVSDKFN